VDLNPLSARANFFLGMALLESGRLDAAQSSIDKALEIGPIQSGFYYGQGVVLEREGKVSEALEAYKRELSMSPDQDEVVARLKALENQAPTSSADRQATGRQPGAPAPENFVSHGSTK
jgi:tetratricopeptide (TPR) repeat protein